MLRFAKSQISMSLMLASLLAYNSAFAADNKKGAEKLVELSGQTFAIGNRTMIDNSQVAEMISGADKDLAAQSSKSHAIVYFDSTEQNSEQADQTSTIRDPFEKVNRVTFVVNGALYRWVLKPTGKVYGFIIPLAAQKGIKRASYNIAMPVRLVNNVAQGKFKKGGVEFVRFLVNSTIGLGGIFDTATKVGISASSDEDMGQTLGHYGVGQGFYLVLPIVGSSSARDTVGLIADTLMNPLTYAPTGVGLFVRYNNMVLSAREYEQISGQSIDEMYKAARASYARTRAAAVAQ